MRGEQGDWDGKRGTGKGERHGDAGPEGHKTGEI